MGLKNACSDIFLRSLRKKDDPPPKKNSEKITVENVVFKLEFKEKMFFFLKKKRYGSASLTKSQLPFKMKFSFKL